MVALATSVFPASIDNPQAPTQFDTLATPNVEHDLLHDWAQDAIKKLEAKLGIDSSPVTTTVDYILANHRHTGADHSAVPFTLKARAVTAGTSLDLSDSINSSLRVKHPSAGIARLDVDSGNSFQFTVADAVKMALSAGGGLQVVGTDHYFGPNAFGGTGSRLHINPDTAQTTVLAAEASGLNSNMVVTTIGTGGFGYNNAGVQNFMISGNGQGQFSGQHHYFGPYAFGGGTNVTRAHLQMDPANIYQMAESDALNVSWHIRMKGTSNFFVEGGAGTNLLQVTNSGETVIGAGGANGGGYRLSVYQTAGLGSQPPVFMKSLAGAAGDGNYQMYLGHGSDTILGWLIGHEGVNSGKLKFAIEAGSGPVDAMTLSTNGSLVTTGTISSAGTIQANAGSLASVAVGGIARLYIKATDAAVDSKVWDIAPSASNLVFRTINDAESSSFTWLTVNRTGNALGVNGLTFGGKINTSQQGTPQGVGTTAGSVAFADNDAHTWEGNGTGQWLFRNGWNSANAFYRWFGGVGGVEQFRTSPSGGIMLPYITAASATTPPVNWSTLFVDSATGAIRFKLSDGTLRTFTFTNP